MVSLVLGILSIILGVLSFFVFWWLSLVGVILGIIGIAIARDSKDAGDDRGGGVLSVIGTSVNTVSLVVVIISLIIIAATR